MFLQTILLVETKALGLDVDLDSDSKYKNGKQIIDVEPSVTIPTTKVHPEEPGSLKKGRASSTHICG
jgi:hypothetical protein